MIEQMGDATAEGFVNSLGKGPVKQNYNDVTDRNAPKVDPYPSVNDVLFAKESVSSGLWAGSDAMNPVTEAPGNSKIVGDITTGMPQEGVSGAPARVGPGDMIADFEPETGGPEDVQMAPLVGDLVTGMPQDNYPVESAMVTEVSPEGLTTGQSTGGYAPGVNQPTVSAPAGKQPSNDRGVAGPA